MVEYYSRYKKIAQEVKQEIDQNISILFRDPMRLRGYHHTGCVAVGKVDV